MFSCFLARVAIHIYIAVPVYMRALWNIDIQVVFELGLHLCYIFIEISFESYLLYI